MRLTNTLASALSLSLTFAPAALHADSKNPADYPLRFHIYGRNETTFYHHRYADEAKGEGRANLFENGNPAGIDFAYRCGDRFMDSSGYETYPARWKKPGETLVILTHRLGSDATEPCELKVDVKEFVYVGRNSEATEPPGVLKQWMADHHYDPEHGLNEPTAQ